MLKKKQGQTEMIAKFSYALKLLIRAFLIAVFILLSTILLISFISFCDSLYNAKIGKERNPLFGVYIIVTESMIPTINVNDAIVVKRVDNNSVEIGDIITFSSNDAYYRGLTITHRVVGKQLTDDGHYIYRTKGDNNVLADTALVDLDSIYGKVILKIPKIGYVRKFVSSPIGFLCSVIIPVLLVIIYEVYRIRKLVKRQDDEIEIL